MNTLPSNERRILTMEQRQNGNKTRKSVCVFERKSVCARVCVCVCVCVCDWERKRERESVYVYVLKIERKRKCVCKCVCVFKRERDVGTVVRSNYSIAGCCVRRKRIEESLLSYSIPIVNMCRKKMIKFFFWFCCKWHQQHEVKGLLLTLPYETTFMHIQMIQCRLCHFYPVFFNLFKVVEPLKHLWVFGGT